MELREQFSHKSYLKVNWLGHIRLAELKPQKSVKLIKLNVWLGTRWGR